MLKQDEATIKYGMALAIVGAIDGREAHVYRIRDGRLLARLDEAIAGLIAGTAVIGRLALAEAQAQKTNGATRPFRRVLVTADDTPAL